MQAALAPQKNMHFMQIFRTNYLLSVHIILPIHSSEKIIEPVIAQRKQRPLATLFHENAMASRLRCIWRQALYTDGLTRFQR